MRTARAFKSQPRHPVTGKRLTIRARTQRELDAYLHRLDVVRQELRLGITGAGDAAVSLRGLEKKRVTLLEAADSYAGLVRLAPRTRDGARTVVRDRGRLRFGYPVKGALADLAGERLEALTAPRVAKHFRKLAEGHAWQSVITTWRQLRAIVRHAAEQGWITAAPWGMWRPARPTHAKPGRARRECCRNANERDALLRAAVELELEFPPSFRGAHLLAAIAVSLYTGARKGEIAGLEWGDVVIAPECVVRIERQYDARPMKEAAPRIIDAPELAPYLLAHFGKDMRGVREPLFPAPSGGHRRKGNVIDTQHLRLVAARAGLGDPKRWSPHSLRDSFVTIEAQACGGDLRRLSERTGHRSIDSLLRYLQTFDRTPRPVPVLAARLEP